MELIMHICKKFIAAAFAIMLLSVSTAFASMPATGSDGSLEWRTLNSLQLPAKALDFKHSLDGKYLFVLTEDQRVLVYNQTGTLQGSIPVDPGVTGLDIEPRGQLLYLIDTETQMTTTLALDFIIDIDVSSSAFKGNIDAPVTVVVFSDFQ